MPFDSCICQGQGPSADQKPGTILLPFSCHSEQGEHTWNQFVIRVTGKGKRDILRKKLAAEGIQTEIYYPRAMHEQDCFAREVLNYPVARLLCIESLALPLAEINSPLFSGL